LECGDVTPLSFVSLLLAWDNAESQIEKQPNKRKRRYIAALQMVAARDEKKQTGQV